MVRAVERTQERKDKRTGRLEYPTEMVAVTPRADLPLPCRLKARSPLDAAVTYCDRHAWYTGVFPRTDDPPVAMRGSIFPADRRDPDLAIRIVPEDVALIADKDGRRYAGTYRIEAAN
jgi:hypothetical protein